MKFTVIDAKSLWKKIEAHGTENLKEALKVNEDKINEGILTYYPNEDVLLNAEDVMFEDVYDSSLPADQTDSADSQTPSLTVNYKTSEMMQPTVDETDSIISPKSFTVEIHDPVCSRENKTFYSIHKLRHSHDKIDQKTRGIGITDKASAGWMKRVTDVSYRQKTVVMDHHVRTTEDGGAVALRGSEVRPTTTICAHETRKGQFAGGNLLSILLTKSKVIGVVDDTPKGREGVGERKVSACWMQLLVRDGNVTIREGLGNYQEMVDSFESQNGKLTLHLNQEPEEKATQLQEIPLFNTFA